MESIKPGSIPFLGILAGIALLASLRVRGGWLWSRDFLLLIGVLLGAYSLALFLLWLIDQLVEQFRRIQESRDELLKLTKEARYLTLDQIKFVKEVAHLGIDKGLDGEAYLHHTDAPLWFVSEFLDRSNTHRTYPVRRWNEGTDERRWAVQITEELCKSNFALPHISNQSAQWAAGITPAIVADKIGISLPHQEYSSKSED